MLFTKLLLKLLNNVIRTIASAEPHYFLSKQEASSILSYFHNGKRKFFTFRQDFVQRKIKARRCSNTHQSFSDFAS